MTHLEHLAELPRPAALPRPAVLLSLIILIAVSAVTACRKVGESEKGERAEAGDSARGAEGEAAGSDTTGLGIPGADTIPPHAPGADSLLALAAGAPSLGPENARVVIIEFSDFECPFCAKARDTVHRLMQNRPDARLIYLQYPILELHPGAMLPAEASLEAHRQGRFWEFHDALFAQGRPLDREAVLAIADRLNLDVRAMQRALDEGTHRPRVEREMRIGNDLGINGTPTFFVNGYRLVGALPYETFVTVYNLLLRASRRPGLAEASSSR